MQNTLYTQPSTIIRVFIAFNTWFGIVRQMHLCKNCKTIFCCLHGIHGRSSACIQNQARRIQQKKQPHKPTTSATTTQKKCYTQKKTYLFDDITYDTHTIFEWTVSACRRLRTRFSVGFSFFFRCCFCSICIHCTFLFGFHSLLMAEILRQPVSMS